MSNVHVMANMKIQGRIRVRVCNKLGVTKRSRNQMEAVYSVTGQFGVKEAEMGIKKR